MSTIRVYIMRCDGCGYTDDNTEWSTAAGARREARAEGWTHPIANRSRSRLRMDMCPACSAAGEVA